MDGELTAVSFYLDGELLRRIEGEELQVQRHLGWTEAVVDVELIVAIQMSFIQLNPPSGPFIRNHAGVRRAYERMVMARHRWHMLNNWVENVPREIDDV